MDDLQVKQLIQKYLDGQCTEEETALVESWYLKQSTAFQRPDAEMIDRNEQLMLNFLESRMAEKKTVKLWPRIAIASAIAFIVIGAYFFRSSFTAMDKDNNAYVAADIAPGKNGATLTLANGKRILINDALAGNIASQSGVKISKSKDGQIIYEVTDQGTGKIEYNTLTTTRGEQTQVRLPDGSLVFLNAASSLRYPTSFAKSAQRRVSLMGEGYFEVAKNKKMPFIVESKSQIVEVLGTHFNINCYADEAGMKTTLLEGSVRVTNVPPSKEGMPKGERGNTEVLKPGEQSTITGYNRMAVANVDLDLAVAWKNGKFRFNNTSLEEVMKQLARWYDVEVVYPQGIPDRKFTGGINRNLNASEALSILQFTKVKFKIDGKKIIVTP